MTVVEVVLVTLLEFLQVLQPQQLQVQVGEEVGALVETGAEVGGLD